MSGVTQTLEVYAEGAGGSPRTRFDFYALARPVQDRLLASVNGRGIPEVLLFQPAKASKGLGWLALS
ncbi:MAG: hypothetical protein RJA70_3428, partial [Pseudomonadota bacterium]